MCGLPFLPAYTPLIHTRPKHPIGMCWYMSVDAYLHMYHRTLSPSLLDYTRSPLHRRRSIRPIDTDYHMYVSAHHSLTDTARSQCHLHYRSPHLSRLATLPTDSQRHNSDA